ncbi:DUF3889 domain-containing protein [Ornithinibacillus gellani]|nr:DUF3889 domain-containing protein [Ornithinibacillus gellani]
MLPWSISLPSFPPGTLQDVSSQEKEIPPYAKWGRLAMKRVQSLYPDADIVDYLHIGREVGEHTSIEKFKLWLKDRTHEFGVYLNIEFDNQTEKIILVTHHETDR